MSEMRMGNRSELRNIYRFGAFALALIVGISTLSARMFYLQVVWNQQSYVGSDNSELQDVQIVPSSRGLIYDASGVPLAKNVVDYMATVTPAYVPIDQEQIVAERLGSILNLDPVYIETTIDSATGSLTLPVTVADSIPAQAARYIEENYDSLPGVQILATSKRQYLTQDLFAHIIGYEGRITKEQYAQLAALGYSPTDTVGQAGLENYYEQELRGTYGDQTVALDKDGKPIPGLVTPGKSRIPGDSLTLNIDTQEQNLAWQALHWGVTAAKVTRGVIIVENPQNGKILAMVSLPGYNDQLFADGISQKDFQALLSNPNQPLVNKAIGSQYAPGSTFKLVAGTAGLQDQPSCTSQPGATLPFDYCTGNFDSSTRLLSQPYIQVGEYKYNEWNLRGWGLLDIYGGVAYSSDTFFYQLTRMVGLDRLTYWADQYGFGKPTGIDLPETATGIVPTNAWKRANEGFRMYEGELMQAGIGQGYDSVTPMQLLNAYCALANGGNVWQPQIVKSITDGSTGVTTDVQPVLNNKLPASADTLETMRVAMRKVVTSRHTYGLVDLRIKVAGKTGTAEFGVPDRYNRLPYHQWFVGFTPADPYSDDFTKPDSQLAVLAFIYGANTWGNVATEVVKLYMMLHYGLIGYTVKTPT
ncbi:MAG: penicillin-binding transpeptidase domain-containing protein [Candidatus Limnocylindrales bacterium]